MVNTKEIHVEFINSLKSQIDSYENTISVNKQYVLNSTNKLVEFKSFIEKELNLKFSKAIKINSVVKANAYFLNRIKRFGSNNMELRYIKLHLGIVAKCNSIILNLEKKIKEMKDKIISYREFKFLISNFNEKLSDKIITDGYNFKMGYNLGQIRIIKKTRSAKKPVDWNASNLTRQAIINAGEIPYNKETAPHGQKWLVYHTSKYAYYWYWTKFQCMQTNRDAYSFNPTTGGYGNIKKLHQYIKHNPNVVLKYKN